MLKKVPPPGKRLLVIATTSRREVLDQMEMMSAFTDVLHVPNLSTSDHVLAVAKGSAVFSVPDLDRLARSLGGRRINIGVKKLLGLLDMARQTEVDGRGVKLVSKLEEEGFVELAQY